MKKLGCLALAFIMMLSFTACPDVDSDDVPSSSGISTTMSQTESDDNSFKNEETTSQFSSGASVPKDTSSKDKDTSSNNKDTTLNQRPTDSESDGVSDIINPSKPQSSEPEHEHVYEKTVKLASCNSGGYEKYTCNCGDSYNENVVAPTYKHDFDYGYRVIGKNEYVVFICKNCGLDALDVDGSWRNKVKKDEIRWYVLGDITEEKGYYYEDNYELVVCGKGAIEDYSTKSTATTDIAPWTEFLKNKLKSITVADGITSIGKNAFNYLNKEQKTVPFKVAGSVKTIKNGAINLNIYDITFEEGVETIEAGAISGIRDIYLPKSIKFCGDLGKRDGKRYYYRSGVDDLLKIKVINHGAAGTPICTLKERCDFYFKNNTDGSNPCIVLLNASRVRSGTALFNGKDVKTDYDTISPYLRNV